MNRLSFHRTGRIKGPKRTGPVQIGREADFFQEDLIPKPVIRIALGFNLEDVPIRASSGLKVYRVPENDPATAEDAPPVRTKGGQDGLEEEAS